LSYFFLKKNTFIFFFFCRMFDANVFLLRVLPLLTLADCKNMYTVCRKWREFFLFLLSSDKIMKQALYLAEGSHYTAKAGERVIHYLIKNFDWRGFHHDLLSRMCCTIDPTYLATVLPPDAMEKVCDAYRMVGLLRQWMVFYTAARKQGKAPRGILYYVSAMLVTEFLKTEALGEFIGKETLIWVDSITEEPYKSALKMPGFQAKFPLECQLGYLCVLAEREWDGLDGLAEFSYLPQAFLIKLFNRLGVKGMKNLKITDEEVTPKQIHKYAHLSKVSQLINDRRIHDKGECTFICLFCKVQQQLHLFLKPELLTLLFAFEQTRSDFWVDYYRQQGLRPSWPHGRIKFSSDGSFWAFVLTSNAHLDVREWKLYQSSILRLCRQPSLHGFFSKKCKLDCGCSCYCLINDEKSFPYGPHWVHDDLNIDLN